MKTAVNLYACLVAQQIWGDSDSLALAQSLGIDDSLKSLSSVTDPPKVSQSNTDLAPVVQRLDNAIQRINHYPVDKC